MLRGCVLQPHSFSGGCFLVCETAEYFDKTKLSCFQECWKTI